MVENNNIVTCVCPNCKHAIRITRPEKPGRYKYSCPACKQPFAVCFKPEKQDTVEDKHDTPTEESHVARKFDDHCKYRTIGGLVVRLRGVFGRTKVFPLVEGKQLIGRTSERMPSAIMFDDPCMSRQSVELNVERCDDSTGQYFVYVMNVLRQKNPVKHNGEDIDNGEEIILHIGDTIELGRTVLTLK